MVFRLLQVQNREIGKVARPSQGHAPCTKLIRPYSFVHSLAARLLWGPDRSQRMNRFRVAYLDNICKGLGSQRLDRSKSRFAPITTETVVDGVALTTFLISGYALLVLMSADLFGEYSLPNALYISYYDTLRRLLPVIGAAYGVDVGIYLALFA